MSARGVVSPPRRHAAGRAWNWWRTLLAVRRRYAEVFGRRPRLILPRRNSERIVQRKLFGRDPRMPALADKIDVKAFVSGRIGPRYAVPTIWAGDTVPSRRVMRSWPRPFVLKGAHGSGWTILVPAEGPVNWIRGRSTPAYGGRVMDRDWNEAFTNGSMPRAPDLPPRPESLDTMIWMAERLAQDFDFVRVDLYEIEGRPLVGELTFYPMSGHLPVDPTDTDLELGRLWRRPRRPRFPTTPVPDLVARADVGGRP